MRSKVGLKYNRELLHLPKASYQCPPQEPAGLTLRSTGDDSSIPPSTSRRKHTGEEPLQNSSATITNTPKEGEDILEPVVGQL